MRIPTNSAVPGRTVRGIVPHFQSSASPATPVNAALMGAGSAVKWSSTTQLGSSLSVSVLTNASITVKVKPSASVEQQVLLGQQPLISFSTSTAKSCIRCLHGTACVHIVKGSNSALGSFGPQTLDNASRCFVDNAGARGTPYLNTPLGMSRAKLLHICGQLWQFAPTGNDAALLVPAML